MSNLNCIIVDHEMTAINIIANKLPQHFNSIEIMAKFQDSEKAYQGILSLKPHLVFLDLQLPKLNGFELLDRFGEYDFEVILTTTQNQYAKQAASFQVSSCLLKPISDDLFVKAVHKSKSKIEKQFKLKQTDLSDETNSCNDSNHLVIPTTEGLTIRKIEEIVRIESIDRYAVLFFSDGTQFMSSYNIGKYKQLLCKNIFVQSHKSHLVNKFHIRSYLNAGKLVLTNQHVVPVSSSQRKCIVEMIKRM